MRSAAKYLLSGALFALAGAVPATAADVYEPAVIESPIYQAPEAMPTEVSGWYLRGDVGYSWHQFRGAQYSTTTGFDGNLGGSLTGSFGIGAGVGYKVNHYLRTDVTLDYDFKSDFRGSTTGFGCGVAPAAACFSTDIDEWSALTLMANAYVEMGTYGRFTPYVGGGIGGAHVKWGTLANTECETANPTNCATYYHAGYADWRFAWALAAGVSVDISCELAADVGYRFRRIEGGRMFAYDATSTTGPGYDHGFDSHQIRAGLRYKLGGCQKPTQVVYQPEPLPVYK